MNATTAPATRAGWGRDIDPIWALVGPVVAAPESRRIDGYQAIGGDKNSEQIASAGLGEP